MRPAPVGAANGTRWSCGNLNRGALYGHGKLLVKRFSEASAVLNLAGDGILEE
jgi:hypothetical protein